MPPSHTYHQLRWYKTEDACSLWDAGDAPSPRQLRQTCRLALTDSLSASSQLQLGQATSTAPADKLVCCQLRVAMSSSHLSNRAESHFRSPEEHELEAVGKKAWDNPVYNGSPSTSLKIRAIYNPKSILENPYEGFEEVRDPVPYQEEQNKTMEGKTSPFRKCCFYIFRGIRGKALMSQ